MSQEERIDTCSKEINWINSGTPGPKMASIPWPWATACGRLQGSYARRKACAIASWTVSCAMNPRRASISTNSTRASRQSPLLFSTMAPSACWFARSSRAVTSPGAIRSSLPISSPACPTTLRPAMPSAYGTGPIGLLPRITKPPMIRCWTQSPMPTSNATLSALNRRLLFLLALSAHNSKSCSWPFSARAASPRTSNSWATPTWPPR